MAQGVFADNWSLQDISNLFLNGLQSDKVGEIVIANGEHTYSPVSIAIIQTEALFGFLADLILRDEVVESRTLNNFVKHKR